MISLVILIFSLGQVVHAQTSSSIGLAPESGSYKTNEDTIYVIGSKEKAFYTPGSSHFLDEEELKKFNYSDVGKILEKVPGVYIQEEDGLGLRPNIGLRGAHPHRSKKVTLMEDGILVAPAAYSAPAAYYFPSTSKISNMEVFKGPSAIKYGPNSIGGAINMTTREISNKQYSKVKMKVGNLTQMSIETSGKKGRFGYRLEAHRIQGETLKKLPDGKFPELQKNDFLMKFSYDFSARQNLQLKIGYADEESPETYLGTSLSDFNNDPYQRYAASVDDKIKFKHYDVKLTHNVELNKNANISTTIYRNQLKRGWFKFNRLAGGQNIRDILTGGSSSDAISILKGEKDSSSLDEEIVLGLNNRKYLSQGIQVKSKVTINNSENLYQDISFGVRVHKDSVEREHSEVNAKMLGGKLQYDNSSNHFTNMTKDESTAVTFFVEDEVNYKDWTVSVGTRLENIKTNRDYRKDGKAPVSNKATHWIPGVGVNYSLTPNTVLLAGVNKGLTIVGPGQDSKIKPEESVNYELGARYKGFVNAEAIGFYSDYKNIKGTCSFSAGCSGDDIDREYNGGEAEIFGLEMMLSHTFSKNEWEFPVHLNYTKTIARFTNSTVSGNADWGIGDINKGDPLPYIPQDVVGLKVGAKYKEYSTDLNLFWKSQVADQTVGAGRQIIPSYGTVDWTIAYQYSKEGRAAFNIDNIFNKVYLASLRPFGARPGKPRTFSASLDQTF